MVVTQGDKQLGLRPCDHQICLKVAGKKFCSSAWGDDDTPSQQEAIIEGGPSPLSPLKNEEQDKSQRRDLLLAQLINKLWEIKIESGK